MDCECPASVYLRGGRIERLGANACGVVARRDIPPRLPARL